MNTPPDDALAQVTPQVLMDLIGQLVNEAKERSKKGETLDLAPIERGVAVMCDKINAMPKAEGKQFQAGLEVLVKQIAGLEGDLQGQKAEVLREMQGIGMHQKANTAYRSAANQYGAKVVKPEEK